MPTSFASAAAGTSAADGSSATRVFSRNDGGGSGDWSRARMNGTGPTTFRRPSQPMSTSQPQQQTSANPSTASPGAYVPPHHHHHQTDQHTRNGSSTASRFSKDQLLHMYKTQKENGDLHRDVARLVVGDWTQGAGEHAGGSSWMKKEDRDGHAHAPDICWDSDGGVIPLGLTDMSEEERENFATSVNSPLKPPQSGAKDQSAASSGPQGRKSSISQASHANPPFSPGGTRPLSRRRETSDSVPHGSSSVTSPSTAKFAREESTPQSSRSLLSRRRTDLREGDGDNEDASRDGQAQNSPSFPGLARRSTTGPIGSSANAPPSPWAASPGSTFSPMGSFGNFGIGDSPTTPGAKRAGFGSLRGGSRLSKFMGQDLAEESPLTIQERSSTGSLGKVNESEADRYARGDRNSNSRLMSGETDPYGDEDAGVGGSAMLGGRSDDSPPPYQRTSGFGPSSSTPSRNQFGAGESGLAARLAGFMDSIPGQNQENRETRHAPRRENEPLSPTDTNPYQSPNAEPAEGEEIDTDGSEIQSLNHPGLSGMSGDQGFGHVGGMPRGAFAGNEPAPSDRSQTSSTGPNRGLSNLGGLGGLSSMGSLSGWPACAGPSGIEREGSGFGGAFGKSVFSPLEELQSPSQNGMGGGFFGGAGSIGSGAVGTIGRGGKLGSLFPASMQAQMSGRENARQGGDDDPEDNGRRPRQHMGDFGPGFPGQSRDTDSPLRSGRGVFDEMNIGGAFEGRPNAFGQDIILTPIESASTPFSQPPPSEPMQTPTTAASGQGNMAQASQGQDPPGQPLMSPGMSSAQANQPPQNQQRTMVMPDRMRWIYKDPSGKTQGPWSGLEMHDWFKAGFFSAELLVKRIEEDEFLPLGQLIRQIGNSREPFLVPRIGIPHGPPGAQQSTVQWSAPPPPTTVNPPPSSGQSGAVQPPFAGAFPTFGTTLTAEQQNNLERRKQEEQFLMARQKEFLAQNQIYNPQMRSMTGPSHPSHSQQLHHHSSAHSLQSQPSYSSITSPSGAFHHTPPQGPIQPPQNAPGLFDPQQRQYNGAGPSGLGPLADVPGLQNMREDEIAALMARASLNRDGSAGGSGAFGQQPENQNQQAQVAAMQSQRAQLQREQAQYEAALQGRAPPGTQDPLERLQQFNDLRGIHDDGANQRTERPIGPPGQPSDVGPESRAYQEYQQQFGAQESVARGQAAAEQRGRDNEPEILSLTQQVQKAASAKQSPSASAQPESAWVREGKIAPNLQFQPPQSMSPLPAPAAQRGRQNLPEALNVESRSRSETPSGEMSGATAVSIAPWAKENQEGSRGPSLKEIQEAEARQAARAEEAAAAARRAVSEQERLQQTNVAPAPGLPASSTWANATTPATPSSSGPPAWTAATPAKASGSAGGPSSKKTLSQIQREEENRKQRAAAASATTAPANAAGPSTPGSAAGKRYADLAGKAAAAPPGAPGPGGAWTTVGAGGKVKPSSGPAPGAPPPGLHTASSNAVPTLGRSKQPPARTATLGGSLPGQVNANEEFTRWAKGALSKGLNSNINVDDFVQQLLMFPPESEIISESVYANSQTMDGRRFAEEFLRRRKLADKGIVDAASPTQQTGSPSGAGAQDGKSGSGGWSEVAKKGGAAAGGGGSAAAKDADANSAFKVVAPKKKGKR